MTLPPKLVTIFCLLQIMAVMMGYLITRTCINAYEKLALGTGLGPPPLLCRFIRYFGLWYLLVPAVWGLVILCRTPVERDPHVEGRSLLLGIALTAVLVVMFGWSALLSISTL